MVSCWWVILRRASCWPFLCLTGCPVAGAEVQLLACDLVTYVLNWCSRTSNVWFLPEVTQCGWRDVKIQELCVGHWCPKLTAFFFVAFFVCLFLVLFLFVILISSFIHLCVVGLRPRADPTWLTGPYSPVANSYEELLFWKAIQPPHEAVFFCVCAFVCVCVFSWLYRLNPRHILCLDRSVLNRWLTCVSMT